MTGSYDRRVYIRAIFIIFMKKLKISSAILREKRSTMAYYKWHLHDAGTRV